MRAGYNRARNTVAILSRQIVKRRTTGRGEKGGGGEEKERNETLNARKYGPSERAAVRRSLFSHIEFTLLLATFQIPVKSTHGRDRRRAFLRDRITPPAYARARVHTLATRPPCDEFIREYAGITPFSLADPKNCVPFHRHGVISANKLIEFVGSRVAR